MSTDLSHKTDIRFSVVVPAYNKADTIMRSIESILTQTHPDFEIIIVNDGSMDDTVQVLSACSDSRVRVISVHNQGVSAARNLGIELATSDWIAFLDADDTWEPDHLQNLANMITDCPGHVAYSTAYRKVGANGLEISSAPKLPRKHRGETLIIERLHRYFFCNRYIIHTNSIAVSSRYNNKLHWFSSSLTAGEDILFLLSVNQAGSICFRDRVCSNYYQYTGQQKSFRLLRSADPYLLPRWLLQAATQRRSLLDRAMLFAWFLRIMRGIRMMTHDAKDLNPAQLGEFSLLMRHAFSLSTICQIIRPSQ